MSVGTVTLWEAAFKEGWTQDRTEAQFVKGDKFLETLETKQAVDGKLGEYALTPIKLGTGGGVTQVSKEGSKELNEADGPPVNQAKWDYSRIVNAIELDSQTIKRSRENDQAIASAAKEYMESNLEGMQRQLSRQLFLDGTGLICQCATTAKGNKVKLLTTGEYGLAKEALRQGWLEKGQVIDIGTKAEPSVLAAGVKITGYSLAENFITVSGSEIEPKETHYISIKNSRSGETSYDATGLRQIVSKTATLGNIKPETEPRWIAYFVDTSGGSLNRQRAIECEMEISQAGSEPDTVLTSAKQIANLENESWANVRFDSIDKQNLGQGKVAYMGDKRLIKHGNCPEGDFTMFNSKNIFLLRDSAPYWLTEESYGKILVNRLTTTMMYGSMEYLVQLGVNRRASFGGFRGLE